MVRLWEHYKKEIVGKLKKDFSFKSVMQVPKLEKIVINVTTAEALLNPKILDSCKKEIATIAGQQPVITKAKKSIATFKLREGNKLGVMVTLRRERMYEFLDRLINISLPRVRDFRGVSETAFDGRGNYSLGLKEQIMFPEIEYDKIDKVRGMNISFVTSAKNNNEGKALLKYLGLPFKKNDE